MKRILYFTLALSFLVLTVSCMKGDAMLYPVLSGERWGYIDKSGTFVVNPQFDEAFPFFDGMARVESDGQTGYITPDGKYAIQPQYYDGTDFAEGLAFVVTENSYPICIDRSGKEIFTLRGAQEAYHFSEGLAAFCDDDDKYGYVDTKGNIVIAPQFDRAADFHEGLACVRSGDKYGYIDPKGVLVVACQFASADDFHEGFAAVSNGKSYGFIDKEGKYVINPQFEVVYDFSDGLAVFNNGKLWGYVDKEGKYAINPQFEEACYFHEGLAVVGTMDRMGYVDKKAKMVINPQFDGAGSFVGGLAAARSGNRWGLIDKKGVFVVNPQFEQMLSPIEVYNNRVRSTFYDASAFAALLFDDESSIGGDLIALCRKGATLKQVAEHKRFSSATVDDRKTLRYDDRAAYTGEEDITLRYVDFIFQSPVYESYYDYYYYNSTRTYQWGALLATAMAHFRVDGKAEGKSKTIAATLFEKAKAKLGIDDETRFDNDDVAGFYGYSSDRKVGFVVYASGNSVMRMSKMGGEEVTIALMPVDKKLFEQWCSDLPQHGVISYSMDDYGEPAEAIEAEAEAVEWVE